MYPIYTYIDSDLSGTAESGKTELGNLVGKQHGFDTVKPVQLINTYYRLLPVKTILFLISFLALPLQLKRSWNKTQKMLVEESLFWFKLQRYVTLTERHIKLVLRTFVM